jgi:hypothetical protein
MQAAICFGIGAILGIGAWYGTTLDETVLGKTHDLLMRYERKGVHALYGGRYTTSDSMRRVLDQAPAGLPARFSHIPLHSFAENKRYKPSHTLEYTYDPSAVGRRSKEVAAFS